MAFVDQAIIELRAGKGGNGIISFRREKFVPFGGPYGGDGGHGGNIYFIADEGLRTLMDFRYNRHFRAKKGENGGSKGMTGKTAPNLYIKVPTGTIIYNTKNNQKLADLSQNQQKFLVAHGGRGGRGNMKFASSTNRAPKISENGEPGQEVEIKLELRLLADIGLIGFPSSGKSTFLSVVTAAKPKIASYPFTTIDPNLGMVRLNDEKSFAIADLPGLIEGASKGVGLGFKFLRHIERTHILLHFVNMSEDGALNIPPFQAFQKINKELKHYDPSLLKKPMVIVATKMDLPGSKDKLKEFKGALYKHNIKLPIAEISSVTKQGIRDLLFKLSRKLDSLTKERATLRSKKAKSPETEKIYEIKKSPKLVSFKVKKISPHVWEVRGERVTKLAEMTNQSTQQSLNRFSRQLKSLGVENALKKSGAEDGDLVTIKNSGFNFKYYQ